MSPSVPSPGPAAKASPARRRRFAAFAVAGAIATLCSVSVASAAPTNPGTGDPGFFTFAAPSSDESVRVNVASGNLFVSSADVPDAAATYHVKLDRFYNSLSSSADGILGPRWTFQVDPKVRVLDDTAAATVVGPSGYRIVLTKNADGTFSAPSRFEGQLTVTSSGFSLSRPVYGDIYQFDSSGNLTGTTDAAGRVFSVQATSAGGRTVLSSFGDQNGRRANFSYNGDSRVREVDDPASGHHQYGYTGPRLSSVSNAGAQTTYGYDQNGFLNQVALPAGAVVTTLNDPQGRVLSFSSTEPGQPAEITTFDYSVVGQTTVTDPSGNRLTYKYDDDYAVTAVTNPDLNDDDIFSADLSDLHHNEDEDSNDLTTADFSEAAPLFSSCQPDSDLEIAAFCGPDDQDDTEGDPDPSAAARASTAGPSTALRPDGDGWGLSDQRSFPLRLADVADLGVRRVRLIVPWDVMRISRLKKTQFLNYSCAGQPAVQVHGEEDEPGGYTLRAIDDFVAAARKKGYQVLLTPEHTRNKDAWCALPTPTLFSKYMGQLLDRYPDVADFTSWNEPNSSYQPTSMERNGALGPKRAAQYFKALKNECKKRKRTCRIASADFVDYPKLLRRVDDDNKITPCKSSNAPAECKSYLGRYLTALDGVKPQYWAMHAYETGVPTGSAAVRSTDVLEGFIDRTTSSAGLGTNGSRTRYWLTEQGGRAHKRGTVGANEDLAYILSAAPNVDRRITRFYVYQYSGDYGFDSGLTDFRFPNDPNTDPTVTGYKKRAMYCTFVAYSNPSKAAGCVPAPETADDPRDDPRPPTGP